VRAASVGAAARNRRLRHVDRVPTTTQIVEARPETAAEAITLLDAQFPWLRGAEWRMWR
jgi:hypothetical protein